ncbi:MAG: leucine-rich repeat domain-containing protein, partial [Candidatus Methanoplasma sp.]|nr:leucine-rich repeat domain-containing protein [Candidatus Methanoplasma sp.]
MFLAAAFFVTHTESNESDAGVAFTVDGIGYNFAPDSGVYAVEYSGAGTNLVIPSAVEYGDRSYSVTSITESAFKDCTSLISIVIPDSVTSIGNNAFNGCTSLTSITIPDSVTAIGNGAFYLCESLISITIPDGVETIGDNAFDSCGLKSVTIPDSVETIGNGAFAQCTSLETVTIGSNVETIGNGAFSGCESLTSIVIPDSVTSVGGWAFESCISLTSVTIPDSVTTIGEGAFSYCESLKTVTIGSSVETISDSAFEGCESLENVTIPDSAEIGSYAFSSCTNLETVTVTGWSGGNITTDGIIDEYFKDGTDWKLPGMSSSDPTPIKCLILRDISSLDYDPNSEDGKGGIAGDEGRELYYSNTKFTWNTVGSEWGFKKYAVTLTKGTGIIGFTHTVNGIDSGDALSFLVEHGSDLIITAVPSEEYAFVSWSGDSDSKTNPLTVSVSDNMALTANGGLIEYYVTFVSGSNYTVYANGSSASSAVGVTGGGSLSFSVRTAEGYSAVPVINGIAYLTAQGDGSYVISEIHSNVKVSVTVSPYSISDPDGDGNGSGNS